MRPLLALLVLVPAAAASRPLDAPPYRFAAGPEVSLWPAPAAGMRAQVAFTEQISAVVAVLEDLQGGTRELRLGGEYVIDTAPIVPFVSLAVCGFLGRAGWGLLGRAGLGAEYLVGPLAVGAELFIHERLVGEVPLPIEELGFAARVELRWPLSPSDGAVPASR